MIDVGGMACKDSKHMTCPTVTKVKVYITLFYSGNSMAVKVMRQNEMTFCAFFCYHVLLHLT